MSSIYAMQFSTGLVKVGRATNPNGRMAKHGIRLLVAGIRVVRQHSALCCGDTGVAEQALIRRCVVAAQSSGGGREWFIGLSFDDVRQWIDVESAIEHKAPAGMTLSDYIEAERGRGAAIAASLGLPPESISQWKTGVRHVPAEHCPAIERFTGGAVRCEELRPDIPWGVLREQVAAE